jgi:HTH-type transcriptional regulator / antitoxin MqsA
VADRCAECGWTAARFEGESFTIDHDGRETIVPGLSGWRCVDCGEVVFDAESAARYAAAGDAVVIATRERQAKEPARTHGAASG